jgi:hypothetical protein
MSEDNFVGEYDLTIARELIPARIRRWIYAFVSLAGIVLNSTLVGVVASGADAPTWVVVAIAVVGSLAAPLGFLAANNVEVPQKPADLTTP